MFDSVSQKPREPNFTFEKRLHIKNEMSAALKKKLPIYELDYLINEQNIFSVKNRTANSKKKLILKKKMNLSVVRKEKPSSRKQQAVVFLFKRLWK